MAAGGVGGGIGKRTKDFIWTEDFIWAVALREAEAGEMVEPKEYNASLALAAVVEGD